MPLACEDKRTVYAVYSLMKKNKQTKLQGNAILDSIKGKMKEREYVE